MAAEVQDRNRDKVVFRSARWDDVPAIVAMLADDPLGATREAPGEPLADGYRQAFDEIVASPHNDVIVADAGGAILGCLQITMIPGLSRQGALRAQIEGVRISRDARGSGLGARMIEWAVDRAKTSGCAIVQLTTDATRTDAHRFYERLGFVASHVGMKRAL